MAVPPDPPPWREPFSLLTRLYADPVMLAIFSEERAVGDWLAIEAALAEAQGALGILTSEEVEAVRAAAVPEHVDGPALWRDAANVGYPIMGLVRMVAAHIPDGVAERVHYGATTQDIMDTGLALALRDALERLRALAVAWGDALARRVAAERDTVLAGRTHAQQAVPTTLGAKLAVFLQQLARHLRRIDEARPRIALVSLYGAGGTSAALGPQAARLRELMGARLGLGVEEVPWHVARDGIVEFGQLCTQLGATATRLAREVIDLSRTEIAEVSEATGHHRGASSTMPQKRNPIGSEAVIGLAVTAAALAAALPRAAEAGHERAAGEWQIEWHVLPQVAELTAAALRESTAIVEGLVVDADAMAANLDADGGLVMAEAAMIALAPAAGRQRAHDLVYEAVRGVRDGRGDLAEQVLELCERDGVEAPRSLAPAAYVGSAGQVCDAALAAWRTAVQ
jgi:3-carboxy-cis,cis-muconate cycloisomerase